MFAASSLVSALSEVELAFETAHPGADVMINFAGSQILAAQLLEGADADVFASADHVQMGRVADLFFEPVDFASNRLVVIASSKGNVTRMEHLGSPGTTVVLALDDVPAGRYARLAFDRLGLLASIEPNIVSNEESVRGVLAKVTMGEADAGVVYATDAVDAAAASVRVIEFPPDSQVSVRLPIAVRRDVAPGGLSQAFAEFVCSGSGQAILRKHGFEGP